MSSLSLQFRVIAWLSDRTTKPTDVLGPAAAREANRRSMRSAPFLFGQPAELEQVRDEVIATVRVRRYVPQGALPGVIVYFHGGGWVVGDLESHDVPCRALSARTSREVVAVDYRLAPEHVFPAAIDDAVAVSRAFAKQHPLVVAGDSAGGHLAAVVARRFANEGTPLAGQLLIYPVTDCTTERPSYETYATGHLLSRASMRSYRQTFLPDEPQRALPDASPLLAPAVRTAPAFILLAECDVLHDEGVAYAEKLKAEGTSVTLDVVPGVTHGFFSLQGLAVTKRATGRATAWLDRVLSAGPPGRLA